MWECLDNVQGDTYFCTENFIPFTPEQRSSPAASAPALPTNGRVPSAADTTEYVPPGPPLTDVQRAALLAEVALSGVLPREPQPSVDADYALALQLAQVPLALGWCFFATVCLSLARTENYNCLHWASIACRIPCVNVQGEVSQEEALGVC